MGDAQFAKMKAGAILINTSRGEVVDEDALLRALNQGLWGAGLDVQRNEKPESDNPLRRHEHVVMTPHIGAQTDQGLDKVAAAAAQNILDVLQGRGPRADSCVNLQAIVV